MTDQLISFETAKLAKEKEFDLFTEFTDYYNINSKLVKRLTENLDYESDCMGSYFINNPEMYDNHYYPTEVYYPAPTQSLLQKWLREKYDIHIIVKPVTWTHKPNGGYTVTYTYSLMKVLTDTLKRNENYGIYEEALEIGLQEALKLI